jgi:hypothetical protein
MTKNAETTGDRAIMAYATTRGIPRYHEGFSFRTLVRNAIPPHSAMRPMREIFHITDERGILMLKGSPKSHSIWSMKGPNAAKKNKGIIATRARDFLCIVTANPSGSSS